MNVSLSSVTWIHNWWLSSWWIREVFFQGVPLDSIMTEWQIWPIHLKAETRDRSSGKISNKCIRTWCKGTTMGVYNTLPHTELLEGVLWHMSRINKWWLAITGKVLNTNNASSYNVVFRTHQIAALILSKKNAWKHKLFPWCKNEAKEQQTIRTSTHWTHSSFSNFVRSVCCTTFRNIRISRCVLS